MGRKTVKNGGGKTRPGATWYKWCTWKCWKKPWEDQELEKKNCTLEPCTLKFMNWTTHI